jgi:FlgD Ig-like domain
MRNPRILTLVATLVALVAMQGLALADYAFDFDAPDQGAISDVGIFGSFHTSITNTGSSDDVITITMVKYVPTAWNFGVSMCVDGLCYSPLYLEHTMDLASGELTYLDVDITPLDVGSGMVGITVTSQGNPGLSVTKEFTVVTTGLDVLLVAGDNDQGGDSWYHNALTNAGKTVGTWKRQEMGSMTNMEISGFPTVVWATGTVDGGLDSDDFAALAYYVQHGGNLFLSGQKLAYESCDPGSPYYSPSAKDWFNTILKTDYAGPENTAVTAAGPSGDLVTGGINFNLNGGSGANNNLNMNALTTLTGGTTSLRYNTANTAAVRTSYGTGKIFFCGFAYEGISFSGSRNGLMNQILAWFAGELSPVGDMVSPLLASVPYATPNPFNPQTSIRFEVGGSRDVSAEVVIYNLKGQSVRNLFQGAVSPGPQNMIWNGRGDDGQNLATGIYLARVQLEDQSETVKMTLVK